MRRTIPLCIFVLSMLCGLISGCSKKNDTETSRLQNSKNTPVAENNQNSSTPMIASTETQAENQPTDAAARETQWHSNWLQFGVDNQFSGYKPDETQINKGNVSNLQFISGSGCDDGAYAVVGGTPSLYQGQLILTYAGGNLEVGDPYTDTLDWSFGQLAHGWAPPPVVSTDGIIYYLYVTPDASSLLYAVDIKSQQQLWESAIQFKTGFTFASQVTVDEKNNQIYVIEGLFGDGRLFGVDRNTGEILWFMGEVRHKEGTTFEGSIVPMMDDKLFVTARIPIDYGKPMRSVRVDPLTQQIDLIYDSPEDLTLSWDVGWIGLCKDQVLSTYQDNSAGTAALLVANSVDKPEILWQSEVPAQTGRLACDPEKEILYVPTEKNLLALDAATGTLIWEHKSIDSVFTPTIANGIIYYISGSNMFALDQDTGSQLFRYPLGVYADDSTGVAVNDGLVIFSGSGGPCDLYVLGLK